MNITAPCVVSLTWTMTDSQNAPIYDLSEPVEFLFGGADLLPKIEEAIAGQQIGFETDLQLEPEHAFGDYRAEYVCFEERALFPEHLEQGMQFEGLPPGAASSGMPPDMIYTVTEIYPSHVVLDGNHPLAGMALRLHLTVRGVRPATPQEIEAGGVHDETLQMLKVLPTADASRLH